MAEKQYISPVRLFEHLGVEYQEEINIPRIKKHLAAEFSMAKDGFIEIDGHTYNRNDVMEEIEKENFSARMQYHQRLWKNHFLLAMLEDNEGNFPEVKTALDNFQGEPAFDEFFSPFFAGPFNYVARTAINNNDLANVGQWFALEDFILPAEREDAFKAVRIFLEDNIRIFKNINNDNFGTFRPKLAHWFRYGWHSFFNNLPEEFFHYKEEIVVNLVNLSVKIQKSNREECRNISNELVQLDGLSDNLRSTILSNNSVYNGGSSGSGPVKFNYWWILWIIIMLLRLASSGSCN